MITTQRGMVLAMAAAVALAACRKQPETVVPPNDPPAPEPTCDAACIRAREDSIARADSIRRANELAAETERMRLAVASATSALQATIYYDYDQSAIRGDARTSLDAKLPILRTSPTVQLRIEGHADERGSDQYNDALSQRRAAEAKRYLTNNGIDPGRIAIVGYGESRPAAMGADESAWARNRRAEFVVTAGTVVPPQ